MLVMVKNKKFTIFGIIVTIVCMFLGWNAIPFWRWLNSSQEAVDQKKEISTPINKEESKVTLLNSNDAVKTDQKYLNAKKKVIEEQNSDVGIKIRVKNFEDRLTHRKIYENKSPIVTLLKLDVGTDLKRDKLSDAIYGNDWETILEIMPKFESEDYYQEALDAAIVAALIGKAPLSVFVNLLDRGAVLPPNAIHILSWNGGYELAESLLSYNLNIHYIDSAGMNAIEHLVYRNAEDNYSHRKAQMIDFLSTNNVMLSYHESKFDALNIALYYFGSSKDALHAIFFAMRLVKVNALINESHYQQMIELQKMNNQRYLQMINAIPQLDIINS